ncbi:MAG: hypothetical protein ABI690_27110 [Chloroflexota bacterium]
MAEASSTNKQDKVRAIYAFAEDLLRQGHTKLEVEKALVAKGMEPDLAGAVVERVVKLKVQARQNRSSRPKLIRGLFAFAFGLFSLIKASSAPAEYGWIGGSLACLFYGMFWLHDWFRGNFRA